ncbi:MAG: hypothetical protein HC930_03090 [Hydrococcus sp. SU_1_0]|nr:hypothetical protein [Hydrococcus sp. SU_1_0]
MIEQAITEIFELEGCRRISKPTKPDNSLPLINQLRARSGIPSSPLLVIGLFVGKLGWTIINTSEPDLFGLRAKDSKQPRLSHLAKKTGCDAFHLSVYEGLLGALLEADGSGKPSPQDS